MAGGAGYVGSRLVPRLLAEGYTVRVLDTYFFGAMGLAAVRDDEALTEILGDVRDEGVVEKALAGVDAVIHLACIANDPSVDLDPELSKSVNYQSFRPFLRAAKSTGVKRFIFASSSSVYGVSEAPEVTEDHPHMPVSLYNKYKSACEQVLWEEANDDFIVVSVRPATLCGYSPRQRLDLTVNILTNHAVNLDKITVFGGTQQRPNLHIEDMVDLYLLMLEAPSRKIAGQAFNAGFENSTVMELAQMVRGEIASLLPDKYLHIETVPSDDIRSYHISSEKLQKELGFRPQRTIQDAVRDLVESFEAGRLLDSIDDDRYYNVRWMQKLVEPVAV